MYNKLKFKLKILILAPIYKVMGLFTDAKKEKDIKAKSLGSNRVAAVDLNSELFLFSTFLVGNQTRQEILQTSMQKSLEQITQNLELKIFDASPEPQASLNEKYFSKFSRLKLQFQRFMAKPAPSISEAFCKTKKQFFCMLFDDQPIIGLSDEFLKASVSLLQDYQGLIDIILIEDLTKQNIISQENCAVFELKNLYFKNLGKEPVATVKYGEFSFALVKNFHYGFFFNTIVGRTSDYVKRLEWFRENISPNNSNLIELAGSKYLGPSYRYLAIPLDVFMVNIDFSHTNQSIRGLVGQEKLCFEALKNNFNLEVIK